MYSAFNGCYFFCINALPIPLLQLCHMNLKRWIDFKAQNVSHYLPQNASVLPFLSDLLPLLLSSVFVLFI